MIKISNKLEYSNFPYKLKIISNPPKQLFYIGNIDLLYENNFAVIGARKVTEYGKKNCKNFTKELVLRDITIVSGMAIGTDTIAHKVALQNCGKTIAVLGSGLEKIYPKENYKLFKEIIESGGLVISEYDDYVEADKKQFPLRNRIISAISDGILIIEAGYRSGTSITCNYAKKQGKPVFAIPSRIDSSQGFGVNKMIQEGAILTISIDDIIKRFPQFINKKRKTDGIKIDKEFKKIYQIIDQENNATIDIILDKTNYTIGEALNILSKMELENIIFKEMGVYKIK